jgi:hypothetical protein
MAISRYAFTQQILGRSTLATNKISKKVYDGVLSGNIPFSTQVIKEGQRLDHIAALAYGSSSLWWVIAAASGIGWGLQIPEGTVIRIPNNINDVIERVR